MRKTGLSNRYFLYTNKLPLYPPDRPDCTGSGQEHAKTQRWPMKQSGGRRLRGDRKRAAAKEDGGEKERDTARPEEPPQRSHKRQIRVRRNA